MNRAIQTEYNKFVDASARVPANSWAVKAMEGTGGKVSLSDLIAYQIG